MSSLTPLPALSDNYIWMLADTRDGSALVVDPGEAGPVLDTLAAQGLKLAAILVTHHHPDHVGGIARLVESEPLARIYAPADDRIPLAHQRVSDGDVLEFDSPATRFRVMAVPGHTRSHVAYYGEGLLFCGDTLFSLGCGRMFEGTPAQMLASLDRLCALPGETAVCCGHEYTLANAVFAQRIDPENPALQERTRAAREQRYAGRPTLPTSLAQEQAANPFLRIDVLKPPAALPASAWAGDRVARFAALRAAKDVFRA